MPSETVKHVARALAQVDGFTIPDEDFKDRSALRYISRATAALAAMRNAPLFSEEPAQMVVVDAVARLEMAAETIDKMLKSSPLLRDSVIGKRLFIEMVAIVREAAMLKRELHDPTRTERLENFYSDYWKQQCKLTPPSSPSSPASTAAS